MEGTIRAYISYTLNAFRQMAGANVDKVTLEFEVKELEKLGCHTSSKAQLLQISR